MPAEIAKLDAQDDPAKTPRTLAQMRPEGAAHLLEVDRLLQRIHDLETEKASLEAFAAVAAHELLQPMILTEAYIALVSERLAGHEHADSRRDLDAVARGARRGRMLVETLLYDARTTGSELVRRPVDLNRIVADCLALLRLDIAAGDMNVRVDLLPQVSGDEALIAGVYKNLLLNALKYAPRSGSAVWVGIENPEGGDPRLFVQSEGPDIPADERERIFEPFFRGQGERRTRGSGLGLTICRSIVERHGGVIGVAAGEPGGNRFYFTLPG